MADTFGLKIGLEGEKEFKAQLKEIEQSFKVLGSEMNLVSSQFDKNDKSVEALTARNQVLQKSIDTQKDKISVLKQALDNASKSFGENDARTKAWQVKLNNAQAELNKMEKEVEENTKAIDSMGDELNKTSKEADKFGDEVKEAGKDAEESGSKFEALGTVCASVGAAIAVAFAAVAAAEADGREVAPWDGLLDRHLAVHPLGVGRGVPHVDRTRRRGMIDGHGADRRAECKKGNCQLRFLHSPLSFSLAALY